MTDDADDLAPLAPEDDAAVTALLASLPQPDMPADVAERIARALADEPPFSGPVPAWAAGGSDNVTVLASPQERARNRGNGLRLLTGVAASVVVLVGLVVVGVNVFPGNDSGGAGGTTAGGAVQTPESQDAGGGSPTGTLLTTSGVAYDTANLETQVDGLVTAASAPNAPVTTFSDEALPPTASPSASERVTDAKSLIGSLFGLRVCVGKLARVGEHPIAADAGSWSGQPAVVMVFRGDQVSRVDVYVVGPGCGDPSDETDHMLYFSSVADPS